MLNKADQLAAKVSDFDALFFKSSEIFIDNYPEKIPFLGGVLLPNISDTGLVYCRLIEGYLSVRQKKSQEYIYKSSEFGKVQNYPLISATNYIINPYKSFFQIPFVEANFYFSPFQWSNYRDYEYFFAGKHISSGEIFYKFEISPRNIYGSFFNGSVVIDSSNKQIAHLDIRIESKNKLNLADSLTITVQFQQKNNNYIPVHFIYTFYYSVQNYTGRHVIDFRIEPVDHLPYIFKDRFIAIEIQDSADFSEDNLSAEQIRLRQDDLLYYEKKLSGKLQDSLLQYSVRHPIKTFGITGIKIPMYRGRSLLIIPPFWKGFGFNPVEAFYVRLQARIIKTDPSKFTYGVEVRPSQKMENLRWQQFITWNFLHPYNGKGEITMGNSIFQINENEPVLPVINSFYSLFVNKNYASYYQKAFLKGVFSISVHSFDIRILSEYSLRDPLSNALTRSPLWKEGEYLPNNPDKPPVISASGFDPHRGLTIDMDLSWQPGRRYLKNKTRCKPLTSERPMYFVNYRKGLNLLGSDIRFDQITLGLQLKRRISRFGVSTLDVQYGWFFNKYAIQFIDFKHFNGIQTLFLQPTSDRWSDIRQFHTLRYYDFSTDDHFIEFHFIHKFGGSLFNSFKGFSRLNIHTVAGLNILSTESDKIFIEPFLGFENIFKVFKMRVAYGVDTWQTGRLSLLIGFNFNVGLYQKYKRI
ncbi:MAG: DUF5686 family protein [Thermaurantimonas sp.]